MWLAAQTANRLLCAKTCLWGLSIKGSWLPQSWVNYAPLLGTKMSRRLLSSPLSAIGSHLPGDGPRPSWIIFGAGFSRGLMSSVLLPSPEGLALGITRHVISALPTEVSRQLLNRPVLYPVISMWIDLPSAWNLRRWSRNRKMLSKDWQKWKCVCVSTCVYLYMCTYVCVTY